MGKYDPLTSFLTNSRTSEVPMTFEEIERVVGQKLPPSKQYAAWWSNNPSNNVMTKAWLAAGYQTERVDLGQGRLVFRRVRAPDPQTPAPATPSEGGLLARIRARLGGTVTVAPGVDLTAPTGEVWDAEL